MNITGYVITADLDPATNHLTATADVTFTALEDLTQPTFELNNGLNITKLTDAQGTAAQLRAPHHQLHRPRQPAGAAGQGHLAPPSTSSTPAPC